MSPKLKPLLLPQMVEDRRKLEIFQQQQQQQQLYTAPNDVDHACMYSSQSSSSSDLPSPSPATSTFSRAHSRYSGSSSSLEMITPVSLDIPASPTQPVHSNKNITHLPDVQEDPSEREDETTVASGYDESQFGLYDCLCDEPCTHHTHLAQSPTTYPCIVSDIDFEFLLDCDSTGSPRQKKRRHGSDAGFTNWGTRLGSKLSSLPRWGSTSRRHHLSFSPASDPSLDQAPPSFSQAASSRSSSISVPTRIGVDRTAEPPLPATPALSFYDSTDSISLPPPADITQVAHAGKTLERERALATTPLLPPLLTDTSAQQAQPSPLQSPTVAPSKALEPPAPQAYPTPPLSAKASVSSFRRGGGTISDMPSPLPFIPDQQDAWSDRLGHANYTIEPKPYTPENADLDSLQAFLRDWDLARINYTKHLVRTGEHYGTTSKTYALTEEKWAELEGEWRRAEDDLRNRLAPSGNGYALVNSHLRRTTEDMLPAAIPRMLSDDAKFPQRGDVDIVGPMVRDAVMARDVQNDEKKNSASVWLKNIAGKVGLRR